MLRLFFLWLVRVGDLEGEEGEEVEEWFRRLLEESIECFLLGANLSTQNLSVEEEEVSTIVTMVME